MAKTAKKTEIRVTVDIKPVKLAEVRPAQRQSYRHFWSKLLNQVGDELKVEDDGRK